MSSKLFVRKVGTFRRMGPTRRALVFESALWLGVAWITLLVVPFRTVAKQLGRGLGPAEAALEIARTVSPVQAAAVAREIGWSVRLSAAAVPFPAHCLHQALAATCMLRRRGVHSALHLGVEVGKGGAALRAHAWVDTAGVGVTGYPLTGEFTEVACFL